MLIERDERLGLYHALLLWDHFLYSGRDGLLDRRCNWKAMLVSITSQCFSSLVWHDKAYWYSDLLPEPLKMRCFDERLALFFRGLLDDGSCALALCRQHALAAFI